MRMSTASSKDELNKNCLLYLYLEVHISKDYE